MPEDLRQLHPRAGCQGTGIAFEKLFLKKYFCAYSPLGCPEVQYRSLNQQPVNPSTKEKFNSCLLC